MNMFNHEETHVKPLDLLLHQFQLWLSCGYVSQNQWGAIRLQPGDPSQAESKMREIASSKYICTAEG